MKDNIGALIEQIKGLERELAREVQRKEVEFFYKIRQKRIHFSEEARRRHRTLAKRIHRYILDSRFLVIFTGPVIWSCLLPLAVLDLFATVYQAICFWIYGIPKVRRSDYIVFDRHRLSYLNGIEKLNCAYCGYANGVLACVSEIAARTEQFWCPIKHALRMKAIHSRYQHFLDFGDAEGYRQHLEEVRRDFQDLEEDEGGPEGQ